MSNRYPITLFSDENNDFNALKTFLLRQIAKENNRLQKLQHNSATKKIRSPASSRHPITRIDEGDDNGDDGDDGDKGKQWKVSVKKVKKLKNVKNKNNKKKSGYKKKVKKSEYKKKVNKVKKSIKKSARIRKTRV